MNWQTAATWGTVVFAAALLLLRLPWLARRRSMACHGCQGCSNPAPQNASLPLIQLGSAPDSSLRRG